MNASVLVAAVATAVSAILAAAPVSAAVIIITHQKVIAGNITPNDPPGYPAVLTIAGPYRLDSNLTVPAGTNGVAVRSHYVDIDMNGHRLEGKTAQGVANYGLEATFGTGRIRNGVITGFKFDGIWLHGANGASDQWIVENMVIQRNGRDGIGAGVSSYSRFVRNTINFNVRVGIYCGFFCHVEGSIISDNGNSGANFRSGMVLGNTIASNSGFGVVDSEPPNDTGIGNNTLIGNVLGQTNFTVDVDPNACVPTSC